MRDSGDRIALDCAEALRESTSIQSLSLELRACSRSVMSAIVRALRHHSTLRSLVVHAKEPLPHQDLESLGDALYKAATSMLQGNVCLQKLTVHWYGIRSLWRFRFGYVRGSLVQ